MHACMYTHMWMMVHVYGYVDYCCDVKKAEFCNFTPAAVKQG